MRPVIEAMSKPLEFYQLERSPFEDGVRDAAAVGTRPLRAALERARRFIEAETAVVCVKGQPGIGKTYFGLALPSVLPGTLVARIGQPAQPWSALHASIAKSFELDPHSFSIDALHELRDQERRLVIEIDPVEQLEPDAFTPLLSLLSHAYLPERRLVQAVLIGDFAGLPDVAREGLATLGSASFELEALPDSDVPSYIHKRLDRAGYRGRPLFSRAACDEIRRRADGLPRQINRICSLALVLAAERRKESIDPELIRDACAAAPVEPASAPSPRAVIGRLQLRSRSVEPAPAGAAPAAPVGQAPKGHVRRIEPLPPEPVVQAEAETPLMDAEFLDDDAPVARVEVEPQPAAPPVAPAAGDAASAAEDAAPAAGDAAPIRVQAVPAPRPARTAEPAAAPAAEPAGPPPASRPRRPFPWMHVAASLAASWVLAAGLFWLYEQPRKPEEARTETQAEQPAFEATAQVTEPSPEPEAPPVQPPAPVALPPAPVDEPTPAPAPAVTALVQTPAAVPPAASAPAPATPAASASTPVPRKAPASPPPAPLRVELRSRGREILYPPRPSSAYQMPTQ
jgi:type II secretory pathway predicted ATPase ExeA